MDGDDEFLSVLSVRLPMDKWPDGKNENDPRPPLWRAANLLIREHQADAEIVAARRADEMLERGERKGQAVWLRIRRAIVELQTVPVGKPN